MADASSWFLYLLECEDGSIYTGITTDVERRYQEHCAGTGAKYTRSRRPSRLLVSMAFENRSMATRAELTVKRMSAAGKREFCAHLATLVDETARRALFPGLPPLELPVGELPAVEA